MSNFHPDLEVVASTREVVRLTGSSQQALQQADPTEGNATYEAGQDIEQFGIAGRTWEAAYALQLYLSPPPSTTASTSTIPSFDPPCLLFPKSGTPKTILEIGSGTGFLTLRLAPQLSTHDTLLLTDLDEVIPLMHANLAAAKAHHPSPEAWPTTLVRGLPWGDQPALDKVLGEVGRPDVILASDLVYFPVLYPALLRTFLGLSGGDGVLEGGGGPASPTLLFSYKVRSFPREEPFWNAFGYWFDFSPVLVSSSSIPSSPPSPGAAPAPPGPPTYTRFGTGEDEIYVFVCTRKASTLNERIPTEDDRLMSLTDDQFERMLMCEIDIGMD